MRGFPLLGEVGHDLRDEKFEGFHVVQPLIRYIGQSLDLTIWRHSAIPALRSLDISCPLAAMPPYLIRPLWSDTRTSRPTEDLPCTIEHFGKSQWSPPQPFGYW